MYCPKCGYGRMPEGTRYCPKCGAPVEIAARVDIRQDVEHNLGRVIGIQTDAIYGDVYGGDIHYHQPQVYVLTRAGRAANWRLLLEENTPPYKGMSPYTARDRALFKGRDTKIRQVVRRIGEQRLLVIYGQAGVGKTSLLAAGVIPNLTEYGALVVYIPEYTQPVEKTFRNALADCGDQIPIALPDKALPALVRTVFEATQGTLVLVLDQFERAFEPSISDEQRTALIEGLAQALRAVGPEFLRLVVVVRGDTLKRLGELQDRLPNLLRSPIELPPLDRQQAQTAIEQPLRERDYPISYARGLVAEQIVPGLDELTPAREMSGLIHPLQLQIVCNWLYDAARERHPPLIDAELYINEAEGADGIMACHLKKTLGQLGDKQALAERVLANMVSPGVERWVLPEQLPLNGASSEQVLDVLESLRKAGLLVQHAANGQDKYAFASDCVAEEVLRGTGPEVKRRYQAGDEMGRIRSTWYARKALATRGQLRYLTEAGAHLTPCVVEALLLLRSAVARDEPAGPWLKWLRTDEGRALIQQLEEPTTSKQAWHSSRSTMHTAKLLLGMRDDDQPGPPGNEGEGFGPVAWSAVGHPEPAIRQTAALALTVPDRRTALNRLDEALQAGVQGWRRRWRRAELRGALANADPEIEKQNANLPPLDRAGVWLWRVKRRLFRDRQRFVGLALAGIKSDPDAAKAELQAYMDEAGYTSVDEIPEIILMHNTSEGHKRIAEAIAEMWQETLGIQVTITNQEWKVYLKTLQTEGAAPQVWRLGWCLDYPDANNWTKEVFAIGGHEEIPTSWHNEYFTALCDEAAVETDLTKRQDMYAEAETILCYEDAAIAPIYWYTRVSVSRPWVNRTYSQHGHETLEKWSLE